ncbi:MAG: hypothetical protein WCK36_03735, partial [Candidatus Firestonebacteria bacterium]
MRKYVLIISVLFVSVSVFAVDIYTRQPKKKGSAYKSAAKEVTVEEAPKYVLPRPDKTVCPVTGVPLDVNEKTPTSSYQNKNYYFLNENAKEQFDKNPFEFSKNIETCDICGKQEKKTRGKATFLAITHNGMTYHFDSVLHRDEFKANPAKFIIGRENYGSKQNGRITPVKKKEAPAKPKETAVPEVKKEE